MSIRDYIDSRWKLDADDPDPNEIDLAKKRFAYRILREDFETNQKREDGKKSEIKDIWTEVYQLVGFYNVFQGVWFQGVTQLAAQRGCHLFIIPIILSVLVSLATIVGVYLKISKLRNLEENLLKDRTRSKVLESFITACEHHGVDFDFDKIEAKAGKSTTRLAKEFEEASVKSRSTRIILLASLTIASILFAWLIRLIMCG